MIVGGIYELEILDYDQKHIFTQYASVKNFLPETRLLYYLHKMPGKYLSNDITLAFPKLHLHTWEDEHHSFISAMKLEKIAYAVFGFFIVGISGFTIMSMMSLAVMQKVPQIGVLKALGVKKEKISAIFIFQAFITWIISSMTGVMISLIIIDIDKHYHLIQTLFPGAVYFEFPLIIQNLYILLIMFVSLLLLLLAAIYPSSKAANMDVVQAIGFMR